MFLLFGDVLHLMCVYYPISVFFFCLQHAVVYSQRTIHEENGNYWPVWSWDLAYYGTQVKLAQLTGNATFASEVS